MIKFGYEGLRQGLSGIGSRLATRFRAIVRARQKRNDEAKDDEPKNRAELSLLRAMGEAE
jgi:hypothetical protein